MNWAADDGKYLDRADPYFVWTDTVSIERDQDRPNETQDLTSWIAVLAELETWGVPPIEFPASNKLLLAIPSHFYPKGTRRFMPLLVDPARMHELVGLVSKQSKVLRFEFCQPRTMPPGAADPQFWQLYSRLKPAPDLLVNVLRDLELQEFRPKYDAPQPLRSNDESVHPNKPAQRDGMAVPRGVADSFQGKAPPREYRYPRNLTQPLALVVDDRCNFASPRLRGERNQPVVHSVWHQSDDPRVYDRLGESKHWTSAHRLQILADGSSWAHGAISGRRLEIWGTDLMATLGEEAEAYRKSKYLPVLRGWSHGSAVVDTIVNGAGRPRVPADGTIGKVAANSVLFAQLPSPTVEDTGGGSLSCVALDAIRDALHLAEGADKRRLIVNLSYGTYSGPHDGTSLFERALSELLTDNERLHVVLPAGNSHLSRTHAGCWVGPGKAVTLRWKVQPDNPGDSFTEVWFDCPAIARIALIPPTLDELSWVSAGHAEKLCRCDKPVAAVIFPKQVAQGEHGSMALCAVSGTRQSSDAIDPVTLEQVGLFPRHSAPATPGIWEIHVHNASKTESLRFDAWVQRGDSAPGRSRAFSGYAGRQGYFLDAPPDDPELVGPDPRSTLNGIATATHPSRRLLVVGASRHCDGGLSVYSGAGPSRLVASRCEGPDLVVPADESLALPGVLTGGMLGSSRVRVGGTSIAAAVVTRMLYQHLSTPSNDVASFLNQFRYSDAPVGRPIVPAGSPEHAAPFLQGAFWRVDPAAAGLPPCKQCPPGS